MRIHRNVLVSFEKSVWPWVLLLAVPRAEYARAEIWLKNMGPTVRRAVHTATPRRRHPHRRRRSRRARRRGRRLLRAT